jgi:hypothetical protein
MLGRDEFPSVIGQLPEPAPPAAQAAPRPAALAALVLLRE